MKNNKGKFLEGALVGAALGVAAEMLIASASGKKMRKDIKKLPGNFYRYISPQLKKVKRISGAQYDALVAKAVKKYAKTKRLSLAEEKKLVTEAKHSWGQIKKHLRQKLI